MWCVPRIDEEYRERMDDILDLYERPLNPEQPVVCLDEKPVVLHGDTRPATASATANCVGTTSIGASALQTFSAASNLWAGGIISK